MTPSSLDVNIHEPTAMDHSSDSNALKVYVVTVIHKVCLLYIYWPCDRAVLCPMPVLVQGSIFPFIQKSSSFIY